MSNFRRVLSHVSTEATNASNRGRVYLPQRGTVLETLCRTLYPLDANRTMNHVMETLQEEGDIGLGTYEDTRAMLVPQLAAALNNHLAFCRQVVKPLIVQMHEAVTAKTNALEYSQIGVAETIANYNISYINDGLIDFSSEWSAKRNENIIKPDGITFPTISELDLKMRDFGGLNNKLNEHGIEWNALYDVIRHQRDWNLQTAARKVVPNFDVYKERAILPVVFMAFYHMANEFIKELPEQTMGAMDDVLSYLGQIRAQAALALEVTNQDRLAETNMKRLVLGFNHNDGGHRVYVSETAFKVYTDHGGTPDALLGLLITSLNGSPPTDVDGILKIHEDLKGLWAQHYNVLTSNHSGARLSYMRRMYLEEFLNIVSANLQNSGEAPVKGVNDINTYMEDANKILQATMLKDFDEGSVVLVTRIITTCFPDDVRQTMLSIQQQLDDNPKLEPREAALLAAVDYVTRWVADQMNKTTTTAFQQALTEDVE